MMSVQYDVNMTSIWRQYDVNMIDVNMTSVHDTTLKWYSILFIFILEKMIEYSRPPLSR